MITNLDVGRRLVEADGNLLGLIQVRQEFLVLLLLCHAVPVVALLPTPRLLGLLVLDLEGRGGLGVAQEVAEQLRLLQQVVEAAHTRVLRLIRRQRGGRSCMI